MTQVEVYSDEPLERALRRFKKKVEREGTLKALKARRHFEKPSVVKRRKARAARSKSRKRI